MENAFRYAHAAHADQKKGGTDIPFLYHPMAVASLVLKYGGDEAQVQAALVHDAVAERGATEAQAAAELGPEVARLAFAFADPPLPSDTAWRARREAYLEKLRGLDARALFVVACEELHDIDELLHDLRYRGVEVWKRYAVPSLEIGWYYRELVAVVYARLDSPAAKPLVSELAERARVLCNVVFEGGSPKRS